MRLLHISDTHAQFETMERLNRLALARVDCEVVAHTGDCVSESCSRLPPEWDRWPQRLKLSVPGNHGDDSRAFQNLKTWVHQVPWVQAHHRLLFVGLDLLSAGGSGGLDLLAGQNDRSTKAVVVLTHERPRAAQHPGLLDALIQFAADRPLLVLHGHEHPRNFAGSEWSDSEPCSGKTFYRSHVCSSAKPRGVAHLIKWRGDRFVCSTIRGDL